MYKANEVFATHCVDDIGNGKEEQNGVEDWLVFIGAIFSYDATEEGSVNEMIFIKMQNMKIQTTSGKLCCKNL
jgi:hypothetical protein